MKLVFIIGSGAVGKMTVGQELAKQTGLTLFHNHMTIEPVIELFGYPEPNVIKDMRESVFKNFAKTDKLGLIFTFIWAFDQQSDWDYVEHVASIFSRENGEVYYVELVADQEERLKRNVTENRLKNKASKRDIETSNQRVVNDDKNYFAGDKYSLKPFSFVILCHKNDIKEKQLQKLPMVHITKGRNTR